MTLVNRADNALAIRILLSTGVDPTSDDNLAIKKASRKGLINIVTALINTGQVDVIASDNYAIRKASEFGHHNVVKLLKKHGGDIGHERDLVTSVMRDLRAEADSTIKLLKRALIEVNDGTPESHKTLSFLRDQAKICGDDTIIRLIDDWMSQRER
jgi:hypothetical protein